MKLNETQKQIRFEQLYHYANKLITRSEEIVGKGFFYLLFHAREFINNTDKARDILNRMEGLVNKDGEKN